LRKIYANALHHHAAPEFASRYRTIDGLPRRAAGAGLGPATIAMTQRRRAHSRALGPSEPETAIRAQMTQANLRASIEAWLPPEDR